MKHYIVIIVLENIPATDEPFSEHGSASPSLSLHQDCICIVLRHLMMQILFSICVNYNMYLSILTTYTPSLHMSNFSEIYSNLFFLEYISNELKTVHFSIILLEKTFYLHHCKRFLKHNPLPASSHSGICLS